MTPTELASLEALAKAATPGEWTNNWTGNEADEMDCVSSVAVGMIADCSQPVLYSEEVTVNPKANAAYIAAFNPAVTAPLIEEYKRMREALERIGTLPKYPFSKAEVSGQVFTHYNEAKKIARAALEPQS